MVSKILEDSDPIRIGFEQVPLPSAEENTKPTFRQTLGAVISNNDFVNIAGSIGKLAGANPYIDIDNEVDLYDEKNYAGIPVQYWPRVAKAVGTGSSKEVQKVRSAVLEEMQEIDILGRSGWTGGALSLVSGVISPTSLFSVATAAKYADFGKAFVSGIKQVAPVAVASSMVSSTAEAYNKETFGVNEWAKQVALDSVIGTGLGALVGAKRLFDAKGIQKTEAALNAAFDDVDIKIKTENGEFKGYKASSTSAGAAEVDRVQQLLDNGIAKVGENWFFQQAFKASPIVKGLTSKFNTVRQLSNRMWRHNLITGNLEKGQIDTIATAQDIHLDYMSLKDSVQVEMRNAWMKYVGIDKGVAQGTRSWVEARKKGLLLENDFVKQVAIAYRNGFQHEIPEVREISKHIYEKLYNPIFEKLVELEKLKPGQQVSTAINYLNRVWDKPAIIADPEGFLEMTVSHFKECNALIDNYMQPLTIARGRIRAIREDIKSLKQAGRKGEELTRLKKSLDDAKKEAKTMKADLQSKIDEGEVPIEILTGKPQFTKEELGKLERVSQPFYEREKELKAAKKTKDKEKIAAAEAAFEKERARIEKMIVSGDIEKGFVSMSKAGKIKFRTPDDKPWIRRKTKDDRLRIGAEETMATILQENPEQTLGRLFGAVIKGGTPSPLKERVFLVKDNKAQNFLVNDMNVLMDAYVNQIGKHIGLEQMYRKYGRTSKEGKESIVADLTLEYEKMRSDILNSPKTPKRDKELLKLKEERDEAEKFINDMNKLFMGDYVDLNSKTKRLTTAMRNYNVSTQLGGLLVTSLTDIMMPVYRHGFGDYIKDGVVPVIKNFKKLMLDRKAQRADFADAGLACETYCANMLAESWGAGTQYNPKALWERIPKNLAQIMGNLNMSNQFSDFMQTAVSMVSQSKTIRDLEQYLSGKELSKKQIERFGQLGLNYREWAPRIMNQIKKFGEPAEGGAWIANISKWQDLDAAQAFRIALNRDIKGTLSMQTTMDSPMWFRKPVIDCITQYMSWGFGATNNLVIPLLQRADAEKLTGLFALMAVGAFIGPLRQLASGREVEMNPEDLIKGAIFESGIGGWHFAELNKWNSALRVPFLENLKSSKYRNKTPMQILGGPLGGNLESLQRAANMILSGEYNKNDLKRAVGLVPMALTLQFRRPINAMIEGTGLAETAEEARD